MKTKLMLVVFFMAALYAVPCLAFSVEETAVIYKLYKAGGGTIRNKDGSSIGKVDSSGTIRDKNGSSIGKVDADGTIRDKNGSSIGKVDSSGTIRNKDGSSTGSIHPGR